MAKKEEIKKTVLPHPVAQVFDIPEGRLSKFVCSDFGEVDLSTVTLEFAERLSEKGYLIKRS